MIRSILLDILGPILLLVLLGAWARWKFKVDVGTLSKLNIYLFVPAFLFDQVSRSTLAWGAMGGVVVITVLQVAILGGVVWAVGRAFRVGPKTLGAVAMAVMFYNSGNYGLPLAELAYPGRSGGVVGWSGDGVEADRSRVLALSRSGVATEADPPHAPTPPRHHAATQLPAAASSTPPPHHPTTPPPPAQRDGAAVQAFVVFCQNLLTFSVGLFIAGWAGGGDWRGGVKAFLRMPTLYTIAAALLAKWWRTRTGGELPTLVTATTGYLAKGFVPLALVTLGAQMAVRPRWPRWRPVGAVLVLRLLFGPVQMGVMLYGLSRLGVPAVDLWPWPAELLILTAAVPTAINTLLLTLEVGGDADLAADCVFWTTVCSCLTITGWLVVLRVAFGG